MVSFVLSIIFLANDPLYKNPSADQLIRQAMEATYNLKLDAARMSARTLQQRFSDHPAGFTIMAETYWWEAQADPGDQAIEAAYYRAQELAVKKAESALKEGKYPQVEVLAYLASAHGSYARFQVTQKGAYFSAMRAGLRAHRYAEEVYRLDKDYYDIYVGLGAFNFFTGSLPAVIKPFAFLIGARGDRDLGLEQLRIGMEQARYSRTEARIVYYTAMLEDKQFAAAFPALERLMRDYPDNFVLYTWVTDWFRQQRQNLEGADYFEGIFAKQSHRSPIMAKYALIEKAGLQLAHSRKAEAAQTLKRIKDIPSADFLSSKKIKELEQQLP